MYWIVDFRFRNWPERTGDAFMHCFTAAI